MAPLEPRKVSVIVPTYNRPALLREALASIRALEDQDLVFEILVCDNARAIINQLAASEFGAIYIPVLQQGAAAARNAGLRAVTGEFIAFLDDDDVWLPEHVRPHIAHLGQFEHLDAVAGRFVCTGAHLQPGEGAWPEHFPEDRNSLLKMMLSGYYPQVGATVARRRTLDTIGFFDECLREDEDWDWHLRIAIKGTLGFVPAICMLFRQRPPGSFDELRLTRVGYARKVFLRHAIAARDIWASPFEIWRAHCGAIWQHYDYFFQAAVERARCRDYRGFKNALFGAFRALPQRTLKDLLRNSPLRSAALSLLHPRFRT